MEVRVNVPSIEGQGMAAPRHGSLLGFGFGVVACDFHVAIAPLRGADQLGHERIEWCSRHDDGTVEL
jgi:hypothetical protein